MITKTYVRTEHRKKKKLKYVVDCVFVDNLRSPGARAWSLRSPGSVESPKSSYCILYMLELGHYSEMICPCGTWFKKVKDSTVLRGACWPEEESLTQWATIYITHMLMSVVDFHQRERRYKVSKTQQVFTHALRETMHPGLMSSFVVFVCCPCLVNHLVGVPIICRNHRTDNQFSLSLSLSLLT